MDKSSLTDADQATLQRAYELASLQGADNVRRWAGATSYAVSATLAAYTEALGAAQALLSDLTDIIDRLTGADEDEDEDEDYHCVTCGERVSIFIDHGDDWHHYRGSGTPEDPTEIYDPGHPANPFGMLP